MSSGDIERELAKAAVAADEKTAAKSDIKAAFIRDIRNAKRNGPLLKELEEILDYIKSSITLNDRYPAEVPELLDDPKYKHLYETGQNGLAKETRIFCLENNIGHDKNLEQILKGVLTKLRKINSITDIISDKVSDQDLFGFITALNLCYLYSVHIETRPPLIDTGVESNFKVCQLGRSFLISAYSLMSMCLDPSITQTRFANEMYNLMRVVDQMSSSSLGEVFRESNPKQIELQNQRDLHLQHLLVALDVMYNENGVNKLKSIQETAKGLNIHSDADLCVSINSIISDVLEELGKARYCALNALEIIIKLVNTISPEQQVALQVDLKTLNVLAEEFRALHAENLALVEKLEKYLKGDPTSSKEKDRLGKQGIEVTDADKEREAIGLLTKIVATPKQEITKSTVDDFLKKDSAGNKRKDSISRSVGRNRFLSAVADLQDNIKLLPHVQRKSSSSVFGTLRAVFRRKSTVSGQGSTSRSNSISVASNTGSETPGDAATPPAAGKTPSPTSSSGPGPGQNS